MKNMITRILVWSVSFLFLFANLTFSSGITGKGLKVGLNFANLHVEDIEVGLDSKTGFCIGVFITYNINEMFAIQPELLYTQKGAKVEEEFWGVTLEGSANLSYLEIPVLGKLIIPTQNNIKPHIYAGPSFAIKLSGKVKAEWDGESEEEDIENLKDTDFGLIFGAGIDFGLGFLGQGKLTVDVRYILGITTISDIEDEDVKNRVFTIMVGYSF